MIVLFENDDGGLKVTYAYGEAEDIVTAENLIDDWLRDTGFFYQGMIDKTELEDEVGSLITKWYVVGNENTFEWVVNLKELELNDNIKESIMTVTKKPPYGLWSVKALKLECKDRGIKSVDGINDKKKLIALLIADDNVDDQKKKGKVIEADVTESVEIKDSSDADKKPEAEDEVDDDEFDSMDRKQLKIHIKRKGLDVVVFKTDSDDDIRDKIRKAPKKIPQDETGQYVQEQMEKPKKRVVGLNQELMDKKLWIKGCQFLSSEKKQMIIDAKTEVEREKIYKEVRKKYKQVLKTQSEKQKLSSQKNKAK